MSEPLLATKFHIPAPHPNQVIRPHLIELLKQGLRLNHRLILISAPAGYGKTSLVSDWVIPSGIPTAWISLDEDDNTTARFWTYLITALNNADQQHRVRQNALDLLENSEFTSSKTFLTSLLNDLSALASGHILLVLDDYHVITNPSIHEELSYVLEHQPPQLTLVITTRADPPLPLSRLRARSQLTELRISDLRFNNHEITTFLNEKMGLGLAFDEVEALEARTEGWIVGLQLAALSMQGRPDTHTFIESFTGSHHYILEYLTDEVLQRQSEPLRHFLLETSILNRLCGSLCDHITGRNDSAEVLAGLNHRNLFIIPLDNEHHWYRYHHLFADLLKGILQHRQDMDLPDLHRRAATWYEKNDYAGEAVHHALAARDYPLASRVIINNWRNMFHLGWVNTAVRWLEALPQDMMRQIPPLSIAYCWTLLILGDTGHFLRYWEEVSSHFKQALLLPRQLDENSEFQIVNYQIMLLQSAEARVNGDVGKAQTLAGQILSAYQQIDRQLSARASNLAYGALNIQRGYNYLAEGNLAEASACFAASARQSRLAGNLIAMAAAIFERSWILQQQGQSMEAERMCREALEMTGQPEYASCPAFCNIYIALAGILRAKKQYTEAENYLQRGLELGRRGGQISYLVQGYMVAARLHCDQGAVVPAQADWREAYRLASTIENPALFESLSTLDNEIKQSNLSAGSHPYPVQPLAEPLTEREMEVLRLICNGHSNQEIADRLVIALDTVKRHVLNIYGKLGVNRRVQAILKAQQLGLDE